MRRWKAIVPIAGIMLLILSAVSMYVSLRLQSGIRPAEEYEDRGVRTFAPCAVYPVQAENTGGARRTNPARTVYMVCYRATDGSGYQWSEEALSRDQGQRAVEAGETVRRRVLGIPSEGTYITVGPEQTAGSYTEGLRERYNRIVGFGALYILFYLLVLFLTRLLRLLKKKRAEEAAPSPGFGPEITDRPRPRRRAALLALLPAALLVFWAAGHGSSDPVELEYGWSGNTWACGELGLRFDLPAGGEIYDAEAHQREREEKFGSRGSAGQTLLTVTDRSAGSNLSLLVVRTGPPAEDFLLKMVTGYAESAAGEGPYALEAREDLTVGGQSWRAWRIELPEQNRVSYYLYRQSGEYALALTASGPMAEAPPAILACFAGESSVPPVNAYLPEPDGEGYYVFEVPPSLLGNKTPEELLEAWREDLESAGDMDQLGWTDLRAGGDGGVRYVCTAEQYQRMKQMYYSNGTRIAPPVFGMDPGEIIRRISYDEVDEDGIPWAVNVWINRTEFESGGLFSDFIASFVPMTMIGRYQLMCGVPAGEWAVRVRLLDAETDAVILEKTYPEEAG